MSNMKFDVEDVVYNKVYSQTLSRKYSTCSAKEYSIYPSREIYKHIINYKTKQNGIINR